MLISSSLMRKVNHFTLMFLLVFTTGSGNAADTEIYFSGGTISASSNEDILPNVLFILDTSGSMTNTLTGDPSNRSRIVVLREAMEEIIEDVNNVNLGLMRFTQDNGGPVLFPIRYIDDALTDVVSEEVSNTFSANAAEDGEENISGGTAGTVTLTNTSHKLARTAATGGSTTETLRIVIDDDDAEERISNGSMSEGARGIDSVDLDIDGDTLNGIRFSFSPGTIPKCSDITDVTLTLRGASNDGGSADVEIRGQDSDSTNTFQEQNSNISSRVIPGSTSTTAFVPDWNISNTTNGSTHTCDDGDADCNEIIDIVEEIVNRGCSAFGATDGTWNESSLVLTLKRVSGSGTHELETLDGDFSDRAQLEITYSSAVVAAQENLFAFRFDEIDIPQGATVSDASLCFIPSADTDNSPVATTLTIQAENDSANDSNSNPLAATANNLGTGRTKYATTSVWSSPDWSNNTKICTTDATTTGNLNAVIQEVAADTGWCGGNAMTLFVTANNNTKTFFAKSVEADNSAIELNYTYDKSTSNGCFSADASNQASVSADDAQQDGVSATADINESNIPFADEISGYRFDTINVPNGATIVSASLKFQADGAVTSGNGVVTIKGEEPSDGDSDVFAFSTNNITDRSTTSASTSWTLPTSLTDNQSFTSPDLTDEVQEIVNTSNWTSGNAMSFIVTPTTEDADYAIHARDGDASRAAKLSITYQSTGDTDFKTIREELVELVRDLPAGDHTPILETMYEATRYWRGETMKYGFTRDGQDDTRLSHPGSYCTAAGACNGADVNDTSTTPDTDSFGVYTPAGCPLSNLDDSDCDGRYIKDGVNTSYITPFDSDSTCQSNYQILLTDGSLYDGSGNASTSIISDYGATNDDDSNLTDNNSCFANNSSFKSGTDSSRTYDSSGDHIEKCSVDLAEFMANIDQNSTLDNDQLVKTYTIAFDLNSTSAQQYLKDIANLGQGEFYSASSATDLVNIFSTFLAEVRNVPTSFVAPSLATNAFNRLLSRDEIYFGLFTPENDVRWPGNAKKFNICIDSDDGCTLGSILDATGANAIDDTDDRFFDDSRSHWSSIDDGGLTTVGGAGAEITEHHQNASIGTKIYTEVGGSNTASPVTLSSGATFNASGYIYKETNATSDNWNATNLAVMRNEVCATPSTTDGSDCEDRMKWLLGKKITTEDDDISADQRWSVTDVLHSSPSIITYGGSDSDADGVIDIFFDKMIYGTNDGAFHMVNPSDNSGREDWRFIPFNLLEMQEDMFDNAEGEHTYGLDSTPVVRVVDHNGNGVIERPDSGSNNDTVHAYFGMRRGGDQIYALDLSGEMSSTSTEITPKFLWKIDGGVTSGFGRLGQTWSRPVLADISFDDDANSSTPAITKTVLIFGGGYDTDIDTSTRFGTDGGADNQGNAIYIVDADTGAKILSISHPGCSSSCSAAETAQAAEIDIKVAEMQFAIPSAVTVLDSDGDGLDDRLYVGDTGGQVWRVDLGADIASNSPGSTVVGRLASIADSAADDDYRRFYEPPSVVQVLDSEFADGIGSEYDYVLLGTGYRAHPLFEDTKERFYAFRDTWINGMTKQTTNNEAADYPVDGASAGGDGAPLSHSVTDQLINVSTQTLQDAEDNSIDVGASLGWYLDFDEINTVSGTVETPGEKVMSAAVTIGGTVFFTTYVPGENADGSACEGVEIGSGRAYNLDILSTKAAIDWDSTGSETTGRRTSLGGGIPSDVVPIFTEEGVIGIVGVEGGATQLGELSGLPRFRTYWYEES
jgi:type IV pilus assembly protein PilY1